MGVYRSKFANRINYPVRLLSLEGACQYLSCRGDLLEELIALGDVPVIRLGPEPRGKRDRIAAQSNIFPEIRARQIVLVDENGKPRCILAMGKEGPGLAMSDENGEMPALTRTDPSVLRRSDPLVAQ